MLDGRKRKVLLVLRGKDTVGKYGTVKALFTGISPVGLRAVAFCAPNDDELEHDYLWRVHRQVPAVGEIAAFNRSHCEQLLVPPVVGWIDADECKRRYGYLRAFQRMLSDTGTVRIKVFLHIQVSTPCRAHQKKPCKNRALLMRLKRNSLRLTRPMPATPH